MTRNKTNILAKSLAGHDAGKVFVVIKEEGPYVYLADGVHRTMEYPKKKKAIHVQRIYTGNNAETLDNITVKKILKEYGKQKKGKQED